MPFPPERNVRGPSIRKRILHKLESRSETTTRRTNSFWRAEETRAFLNAQPYPASGECASGECRVCHCLSARTGWGSGILSVLYLGRMTGLWKAFFCRFARICWGGYEQTGKTAKSLTGERDVQRQDVPLLWQARWFWKEQFSKKCSRPLEAGAYARLCNEKRARTSGCRGSPAFG
jgi:hypothetical protein